MHDHLWGTAGAEPRPSTNGQTRGRPTMDAWERQQVFREMVAGQLRNGPLSGLRRRQLVQYAAVLDINAVLAGRLIAQARKLAGADAGATAGAGATSCAGATGGLPASAGKLLDRHFQSHDGKGVVHPRLSLLPAASATPIPASVVVLAGVLGSLIIGALVILLAFV